MSDLPLVSAIMPTRGRPLFAHEAVVLFQSQTWPNKELVIIDDEEAPSFPRCITGDGIRYERLWGTLTVGAKRNIACSRAQGEIIIHWDDDDFSAPERMSDQVNRLLSSDVELTGYNEMLFTDGARWWFYGPKKDYVLGTSMCYRRSLWARRPFEDRNIGEDLSFQMGVPKLAVPAGEIMWARTHPNNTSPRVIRGPLWREVEMQAA